MLNWVHKWLIGVQEVAVALDQYVCAERRAMQWVPAQGPVRLQRLVMSKRKDKRGNLLSDTLALPYSALLCTALFCTAAQTYQLRNIFHPNS